MKLKINIEFHDKYTGKEYIMDKEYVFNEARAKELLADPRHLVSLVKEDKPKKDKSKSK